MSATVLLLGLAGAAASVLAYGREVRSAEQAMIGEAGRVAATVSTFVAGEQSALAAVAASDAVTSGDREAMRNVFRRADPAGFEAGGGFAWVDAAGRLQVLGARPASESAPDLSGRQYVRDTLRTGRPVISSAVVSAGVVPIVVLTYPSRSSDGRLSGLVIRAIRLSADNPLLAATAMDGVHLVDHDGTLLVDEGPVDDGRLIRVPDQLREALVRSPGAGLQPDTMPGVHGESGRSVATAPVERTAWHTVIDRPRSRVVGEAARRLFTTLAALVVAAVTATTAAVLILRRVAADRDRTAALYQREHQIALDLQAAMLPDTVPEIPGVEIALAYRAASNTMAVGGDWYDVYRLSADSVGITVGDVVGHSLKAATVMGQLRSAANALAPLSPDPSDLLARLDHVAGSLPGAEFGTVVAMDLQPRTGRLRWTSAGHPPPVLIAPDGSARVSSGDAGVPLALGLDGDETCRPLHEVDLEPGSMVVLYTDGLVERRSSDLDAGLQRLVSAASASKDLRSSSGDRPVDLLRDQLLRRLHLQTEDDVALVCVHYVGVGTILRPAPTPAFHGRTVALGESNGSSSRTHPRSE